MSRVATPTSLRGRLRRAVAVSVLFAPGCAQLLSIDSEYFETAVGAGGSVDGGDGAASGSGGAASSGGTSSSGGAASTGGRSTGGGGASSGGASSASGGTSSASGGTSSAGGGTSSAACDTPCSGGEKCCAGTCTPPDPIVGCSGTGCTPCPAPSSDGIAGCFQGECVIRCNPGFALTGGQCVGSGSGGAPATVDAGKPCNPAACSGCGPVGPLPCCRKDGNCGCTWAPGAICY